MIDKETAIEKLREYAPEGTKIIFVFLEADGNGNKKYIVLIPASDGGIHDMTLWTASIAAKYRKETSSKPHYLMTNNDPHGVTQIISRALYNDNPNALTYQDIH